MRMLLIAVGLGFIVLFLVLPLVSVFAEAFRHGIAAYLAESCTRRTRWRRSA